MLSKEFHNFLIQVRMVMITRLLYPGTKDATSEASLKPESYLYFINGRFSNEK